MSLKSDIFQLLKPYYIVNIFLSLSYIILKKTPGLCNYLFNVEICEFNGRETEILFFLLIVVMMRSRKSGNLTMINYLSSSFIYTKCANLVLWFSADYLMGLVYGALFVCALLVPEPTYSGPSNIVYFRDEQSLTEQIAKDINSSWLVAFYTVWNPSCVNFAPIFAKLSTEYGLENLKFGKIDIGRYPDAGKKYHVSDSTMSKQLPTVILFEEGKEVVRRPTVDTKGKLAKFAFSPENLKMAFGLNSIYEKRKNDVHNDKVKKTN